MRKKTVLVYGVIYFGPFCTCSTLGINKYVEVDHKQEVKVIWQKAHHGGPIPRLGVTPGGRN